MSELSSSPPVAEAPTSICALAPVPVEVVPTTFVPAMALMLATRDANHDLVADDLARLGRAVADLIVRPVRKVS